MAFLTGKRLSSPFSKGGPRGILLRGRFPEDHRSILSVQAKLNYTIPTSGQVLKVLKLRYHTSLGSLRYVRSKKKNGRMEVHPVTSMTCR
jgi:hypothetical protein